MVTAEGLSERIMFAAREAKCTRSEARLLGTYAVSEGLRDAAQRLGIAEQTAKNQSTTLRKRLGVSHLGGAIAVVLTNNKY